MSDPTDGAMAPGQEPASGRRKRPNGRKRFKKRKKFNPGPASQNVDASTHPAHLAKSVDEGKNAGSNNRAKKNSITGGRGKHSSSRPLYAALDLGTNNCRLLIAVPQRPGRFRVVDGFSRIVRSEI